jgi:acyl-CoA reductase-like NAD-dependent aldehyde dehydrogenase
VTGVLIDGKWRSGGAVAQVRDKFTQQPAAEVTVGTEADAVDAVNAAALAAESPLPPARRHQILSEAARLLAVHAAEVTASYIAETGFTRKDAETELARAIGTLRLSAEEAIRIAGEEVPVAATPGSENRLAFTIRVPVGVVVAIAPFNAPLLAGGDRDGALLSPAVLYDPPPGCAVMTDEIFAPVLAVVPVQSVDDAVGLVNAGRYGLQAGVFTKDLDVAFDVARRLRVGGVMINDTSSYHADAMPYGGVKDSGYGLEGPRYAVQDMTDPRIIVLNLGASR